MSSNVKPLKDLGELIDRLLDRDRQNGEYQPTENDIQMVVERVVS